jgi:hypothetical protein
VGLGPPLLIGDGVSSFTFGPKKPNGSVVNFESSKTVPLLVVLLAACGDTVADRTCRTLRERFAACAPKDWPAAATRKVERHCRVAMAYRPEPGSVPGNMAEVDKATFEMCAAAATTSCEALHDCFDRRGCTFVLSGPTDREPELWCTGVPD